MQKKNKGIIIYVPAIHQGYLEFFGKYLESGDALYLIDGKELANREGIPEIECLNRNLCALATEDMFEFLKFHFKEKNLVIDVRIVKTLKAIQFYADHHEKIIMPADDVSAIILQRSPEMNGKTILEKMFLRWDKNASLLEKDVNVPVISSQDLPENVVAELKKQINKSVDWWRQVACVVYDDHGNIILAAYNRHFPNDLALNIFGDPRFNFKPGKHIENCSAIHSEAWAIAQAANQGISLKGLNMLVSDFPCPVCAKSIAYIGIKNLSYVRGYSKIDGQKTLEDAGIKLQKVIFEN